MTSSKRSCFLTMNGQSVVFAHTFRWCGYYLPQMHVSFIYA